MPEECVTKELYKFFKKQNIIPDYQHGFMNKKSTVSNLLEFFDDVSSAIDNKRCIDGVSIDLYKAFDSVNHKLLLAKLESKGISGSCLKWLEDFLYERKAAVKIGQDISSDMSIGLGLPQGSPISPIIFNFFISDLVLSEHIVSKFYADDLKMYIEYNYIQKSELQNRLDKALIDLDIWCSKNGLNISVNKCGVFYFGISNDKRNYLLKDNPIPIIQGNFRDLGILISPDLKWNDQVQRISQAALRRWFNFMRVIRSKDFPALVRIFKAYIRPLLEYGSVVFNSYSPIFANRLEKVQRKITRHIFIRCNLSTTQFPPNYLERLKKLNLETLKSRRLKADLICMHKIINGQVLINENNKPKAIGNRDKYSLRNKYSRAFIPYSRTNTRINSFFIRVPKMMHKLPPDLLKTTDLGKFVASLNRLNLDSLL